MANNTVGELIIVNSLPTQQELINQSITVSDVIVGSLNTQLYLDW